MKEMKNAEKEENRDESMTKSTEFWFSQGPTLVASSDGASSDEGALALC